MSSIIYVQYKFLHDECFWEKSNEVQLEPHTQYELHWIEKDQE